MWLTALAGAVVLSCMAAIAYMLGFSRPVAITKNGDFSYTHVVVRANRDIARMELVAGDGLNFVRKGIARGHSVEFSYPASMPRALLRVEFGNGRLAEYAV